MPPRAKLILALAALTSGCWAAHERPTDATPRPDAGAPAACAVEGAGCDDGDACTRGDLCRAGRCLGEPLRCDDPPACHAPAGTCVAGACEYAPLTGTPCDDGDACTASDVCEAGVCAGAPLACETPPAAVCLDAETLREALAPGSCGGGECSYPTFERPCQDGCLDGACVCRPFDWRAETIDEEGDVGRYNAIAVDREGGVHVAYYVAPLAADLRYAHRDPSGRWSTEVVDVRGDVGGSPSITLDASGRPHVVYDDLSALSLRYATRADDGTWTTEQVDAGGRSWGGSLAVTPSGEVHVAYTGETPRFETHLRYARRSPSGGWTQVTLVEGAEVGLFPSLAIDAAGGIHVVHLDAGSRVLEHVHRAPGATEWTESTIDDAGDLEGGNAIAVDRTGGLHVGYFRREGARLHHAFRGRDGTWRRGAVEGASHARWNVALGVDPHDGVHLLFDSDAPDLFHAYRPEGGAWSVERVASTGFTLSFLGGTALAVGPRGDVHVAHYDERSRALRYAVRRICP